LKTEIGEKTCKRPDCPAMLASTSRPACNACSRRPQTLLEAWRRLSGIPSGSARSRAASLRLVSAAAKNVAGGLHRCVPPPSRRGIDLASLTIALPMASLGAVGLPVSFVIPGQAQPAIGSQLRSAIQLFFAARRSGLPGARSPEKTLICASKNLFDLFGIARQLRWQWRPVCRASSLRPSWCNSSA